MKKTLYILIAIISFFCLSCAKGESNKLEIKGNDIIEIGYSSDYKVYYEGNEIENDSVYWIVDNSLVVERIDNTLVGKEAGIVNLTAVLKNNSKIYTNKQIQIIDSIVDSISVRGYKSEAYIGDEFIVNVEVEPIDAINEASIEWYCDNDSVLKIDPATSDAIISCVGEGSANVTVKCSSAVYTFTMNVKKNITEIEMYNDYELCIDSVLYLDFNIDDAKVEVLSDNIVLTDMYLYGISEGVGQIKVSQKNNKKLSPKVFEINVISTNKGISIQTDEEQKIIDSYLNNMTLEQKIGQMMMLNLSTRMYGWKNEYIFDINEKGLYYYPSKSSSSSGVYVKDLINSYPFGSYRFTNVTSSNSTNVSNVVVGMQRYFLANNKVGGIINIEIGDYFNRNRSEFYTVLGEGFNTYNNNIVLGTINDFNILEKNYNYLSADISATGVNLVTSAAYAYSESTKDKYSNLKDKQILYSSVLNNTLEKNDITLSPLFSSAYNIDTNKTLIQSAINECIESISITYSDDDLTSGVSYASYLRNASYNGLIIDVDTHYDNSRVYNEEEWWNYDDEFYYDIDYYAKAINDGVDIFNIFIFLENENDRWSERYQAKNEETFNFLSELKAKVEAGEIEVSKINEAVSRILLFKIRNRIIDGTYPIDNYEVNKESQEYNDSVDDGFNTISIKGTFKAIDKSSVVNVYFGDNEISSLIGEASYISRGYNMNKYVINKDSLDTLNDDIEKDSQVILFIDDYYCAYSFKETVTDEDGNESQVTKWSSIDYTELVERILAKTSNITLIFTDSPDITDEFSDLDVLKIFLNYQGWDTFNPLFDVLERGNAKGVCLDEK